MKNSKNLLRILTDNIIKAMKNVEAIEEKIKIILSYENSNLDKNDYVEEFKILGKKMKDFEKQARINKFNIYFE